MFCCQKLLIEELQRQAKEMEKELDCWNKGVVKLRKHFYELNYYTTHQLLVLRRELGKLKSSEAAAHSLNWGQVMALLGSISTAIPCAALADVVQQIVKQAKECVNKPFYYTTGDDVSLYQVHQSPSDTQNTGTKVKRLPNLSGEVFPEKDLSADQRAYYTRIVEKFDYSKTTALKAIEDVKGGDWNDVENWLKRNGPTWEKAVQEAEDTEDDEEVEGVESEIEDAEEKSEEKNTFSPTPSIYVSQMGKELYYYLLILCLEMAPSFSSGTDGASFSQTRVVESRVVVAEQQVIDEANEEVQKLFHADMGTVEECIAAIEMYGTASKAFKHMLKKQPVSQDKSPHKGAVAGYVMILK